MIINEMNEKGKLFSLSKLFIPGLIILLNLGFFGGWKLYKFERARTSIVFDTSRIEYRSNNVPIAEPEKVVSTSTARTSGKYVGSRGGKSFYLLSCAGAKRISEKNKIFFNSKEEAAEFGYTPAKNCKGI